MTYRKTITLLLIATGLLAAHDAAQAQIRFSTGSYGSTFGRSYGSYFGRSYGSSFGRYGPYLTRPYSGSLYSSRSHYGVYSPRLTTRFYSGSVYPSYRYSYYRSPSELYGGNSYYSAPNRTNSPTYNTTVNVYRSYYPPNIATPRKVSPKTTTIATTNIQLLVPTENAQVWFNGVKTSQTGKVREFVTPPLESGTKNQYRVRVVWTDKGVEQEANRTIEFESGKPLRVDFRRK